MNKNPNQPDLTVHFIEGEQILQHVLATINPQTGRPWRHILTEPEAGGYLLSDRLRNIVSWLARTGPDMPYAALDEDDADSEVRFGLPIRLAVLHGAVDAHAAAYMAHHVFALNDLSHDQLALVLTPSEDRWERLVELGFGPDRPWTTPYPLALTLFTGWNPPADMSDSGSGLLLADCSSDAILIDTLTRMGVANVITQPST